MNPCLLNPFTRSQGLCVEKVFELSGDKEKRNRLWILELVGPERPLERPWPTPTPGVPLRREEDRMLRLILDKLIDIEKRLDRIEKHLCRRPSTTG